MGLVSQKSLHFQKLEEYINFLVCLVCLPHLRLLKHPCNFSFCVGFKECTTNLYYPSFQNFRHILSFINFKIDKEERWFLLIWSQRIPQEGLVILGRTFIILLGVTIMSTGKSWDFCKFTLKFLSLTIWASCTVVITIVDWSATPNSYRMAHSISAYPRPY